MAEAQYFPSVLVAGVPTLENGVEVQTGDVALMGQCGLMDDRLLADLLRVFPFTGSAAAKGVIPFGYTGPDSLTTPADGTVQPSGSANGSIKVYPFRAVVGSRTAVATSAIANWRDIRSGVWVGSDAAALTKTIQLAANSSGNPRWDLIYASLTIDAPTNSVSRRVKDPSTGVPSVVSIYQSLTQPVVVTALSGTPGATPSIPALPADSGNVYNVALAAVRVPNGFGATTTIAKQDIRDQSLSIPIAAMTGAVNARPATGNTDKFGTYATNFPWAAGTTGQRPSVFLPPSMVGGVELIVLMDMVSSTTPSHSDTDVIDFSIDWRNRFFDTVYQVATSELPIASSPTAGAQPIPIPSEISALTKTVVDVGASFQYSPDGHMGTGRSSVFLATATSAPGIVASGCEVGAYVDSSGILRAHLTGTNPNVRIFARIRATGQFPNG